LVNELNSFACTQSELNSEPKGSVMLSNLVRKIAYGFLNLAAQAFQRAGFSPNGLTVIGFVLMLLMAVVIAAGYEVAGAGLLLVAGIFDGFDGALARLTNRVSKFGAFLDSTLDRFAEGALYLALVYRAQVRGDALMVYLVVLTLVGSLMVSYTRARAEGLGVECKEGLLTRFERLALVFVGLILTGVWGYTPLVVILAFLAVFTNVTAVQRILVVYRATRAK
jgi:CDP-diacylglycerol--glycerol-3-phosphate 3-phosphatidyltransferase